MFKLPFLNKSLKKGAKYLTLELGYDSLRVLSFYKEDGATKIIGSAKEPVEPGCIRNGIIVDINEVIAALEKAVTKATLNIEDDVENIIIGVSSDVCIENVTTAKITRTSTNPITQKEIDEFEQKLLASAYIQVQNKFAENTGNTEEDFQLITSSLVHAKIDDKKITTLNNQKGQIVEMAMYTAYCPEYFIKSLQKMCKSVGLNILAIASVNFGLLKGLKSTEMENTDLVTINIGPDFTNVAVVFGGAIVASKSLHVGKRHLIEEVARKMGLTGEEAANVVNTHTRGELASSESVVVQDCMEEVLNLWLEGVELVFSDFSGVKTFAPHIYLFGVGIEIPEIEEKLNNSPWTKSIPFKAPPTLQLLHFSDLPKIADATGDIKTDEWIGPASLSYIFEELI